MGWLAPLQLSRHQDESPAHDARRFGIRVPRVPGGLTRMAASADSPLAVGRGRELAKLVAKHLQR
jgi:hypothetical protein